MLRSKDLALMVMAVTCTLGVAACGSSAPSATEEPAQAVTTSSESAVTATETQSGAAEESQGAGGFSGQDATNYEDAKAVCEASSRTKVAKELGLSPDAEPTEIAEAYSHGYRGSFQQAVFEGCLAGLR